MEVGPFSVSDVSGITEFLESKNIKFEILVDHDAEKEILADFNSKKIVYVEISDSDFEKVAGFFEKYGITPISDGSYELGE